MADWSREMMQKNYVVFCMFVILLLSIIICCSSSGGGGEVSETATIVPQTTNTSSPRTGDDPNVCGLCGYTDKIDSITGTTYTINNLSQGTYYFSITAYDENGIEGNFSAEISKTISSETGNATLTWSASSDGSNVAGYKIYYGKSQ